MDAPNDAMPAHLLRLCLRARWAPAALDTARAVAEAAGPAGWQAVQHLAEAEGLAPLLYHVTRGQDLLPADVAEALRKAYYATAARNMIALHELERVLHTLAGAGIPVILLKGAALAQAVYRNPALRPMGDLDLLLHHPDVRPAIDLLRALGYEPSAAEPHPGDHLAYKNEIVLTCPGRSACPVELHWSLFDSPYYLRTLPIDWFWRTALPLALSLPSNLQPSTFNLQPSTFNLQPSTFNLPPSVLSPEAQILHLCGHLALHHGGGEAWRGLWLYDLAEVIGCYGGQIDWTTVIAQARASDLVLPIRQVLARVIAEWQPRLPDGVSDRLQALRPSRREERLYAELAAVGRSVTRHFWSDLSAMSGFRARLTFAWTNLFPSPAYMRRRYAIRRREMLPLYYVYRWWLGVRGLLDR